MINRSCAWLEHYLHYRDCEYLISNTNMKISILLINEMLVVYNTAC